MNLKQAAAALGVHYQTAYKWVRDGTLPAVRIGARYEISDEAVAAFQAKRRSYVSAAAPIDAEPADERMTAEDLVEEAEAMLLDPLLSTHAVAMHTARRASACFDALAFVSLERHDGTRVSVFDHPRPDWITFVASLEDLAPMPASALDRILGPLRVGDSVFRSHVPVDEFVGWLRPELRQYLDEYAIRSLIGVPVRSQGRCNGWVVLTRNGAGPAFTRDDAAALERYGRAVGNLVGTAHAIRGAWIVRAAMAESIADWCRRDWGPLRAGDAQRLVDSVAGESPYGICVFDRGGALIAANRAFVVGARHVAADAPIGLRFDEMVDPEFRAAECDRWDALVSGACDYDDINASRQLADDAVGVFGFHRGAVRRGDGAVVAVVCVARHLAGAPDPSVLRSPDAVAATAAIAVA